MPKKYHALLHTKISFGEFSIKNGKCSTKIQLFWFLVSLSIQCYSWVFLSLTGFTRAKLVQSGTTSFLATIVFPEHPLSNKTDKLLQTLESHVGLIDGRGAVLEGIHSEVCRSVSAQISLRIQDYINDYGNLLGGHYSAPFEIIQ